MLKKTLLLLLVNLLPAALIFAQSPVSVNPVTGAANVAIPIGNYQRGSIKFPIALVYNGSGVKPTDVEGTAGISWEIQAGGAIFRQPRGLPDDIQQDNSGNTRTGWMYNTNQATISTFPINNTGTPNCANEQHDISNINSNFSYTSDTEPDIFYVSAPGLNCQLIYDQTSAKFHPVEYQDLVIAYGTATDHTISSFTITNDAGTKYLFNVAETAYQQDSTTVAPSYLANSYNQYRYGITYTDKWFLTSITDINGNSISLSYTTAATARRSQDSVKLYIGGSSTATLQYIVNQSVAQKLLSSVLLTADEDINLTNETLTFNWTNTVGNGTGQYYITSITGNGHNRVFTYSPLTYVRPNGINYTRGFLSNFSDSGCGSPINYGFTYAGEGSDHASILLPDSSSTQIDYWGYYTTFGTTGKLLPAVYANSTSSAYPPYLVKASSSNPHYNYTLTGANRAVDTSVVYYGSLTQITNAQEGTTTITYESNDYYDPSAATTVKGGGIRVKQLIDYDGISTAHNIVRSYSYINPSTGNSSGKPVTLPQFAFTIPYSGSATGLTLWTDVTALSAYDLSNEDHTIMYEYEKESMSGAGSTLSRFYVPGTAWDASAAPDCSGCTTEWYPTVNLVARPTCVSYGPVAGGATSYPFIPNPNYDFERGLPRSIKAINSSNDTVSIKTFSYQRSSGPTAIAAFKYEDDKSGSLSVRAYNKYLDYYSTSELLTQQTSKVYDSAPTPTQANADTLNLTYGSVYHKLKTKQVKNSDGSTVTQNFSYIKDYAAAADTNHNISAIYNLQQQNVDWPVESYTSVSRGGISDTTQAALTLYSPFTNSGTTVYRPSRQLKWVHANGAAFKPFSINTGAHSIKYDTLYFPAGNITGYDYSGVPHTADDANKHVSSAFFDHVTNMRVASFTNAAATEVCFLDFDSDVYLTNSNYTDSGNLGVTTDRNGKSARILATGKYINYTLTKNSQAANYIFSAWLNCTVAGSHTLTIQLTSGSTNVSKTIPFSTTAGWQYFESVKIPVTTLSGTVTVNVTTSATVSIDDILCYPENTEATTVAFDPVQFFAVCKTNTNGVSAYSSYDTWGRLLYAYDQDHNILQKKTYVNQSDRVAFGQGIMHATGVGGSINTNTPVSLSINLPDACLSSDFTYTWHYGDGSAPVQTTLATAPSHLYRLPGTYTDTLVINSPALGQKTYTLSFSVPAGTKTNLTYFNYTTANGNIATVAFYTGATLIASFTAAQLLAGTAQITKGSYTMKITMATGSQPYPYPPPSGTGGYGGLTETGDGPVNVCQSYSSTNAYSFSINLTSCNSLVIGVYKTDQCL